MELSIIQKIWGWTHWRLSNFQQNLNVSVHVCMLSHFSRVWLFATLWTVAYQTPRSMGFPRQEYWSGLPYSPPGDLLHPRIEPESSATPALAGGLLTAEPPGKPLNVSYWLYFLVWVQVILHLLCAFL